MRISKHPRNSITIKQTIWSRRVCFDTDKGNTKAASINQLSAQYAVNGCHGLPDGNWIEILLEECVYLCFGINLFKPKDLWDKRNVYHVCNTHHTCACARATPTYTHTYTHTCTHMHIYMYPNAHTYVHAHTGHAHTNSTPETLYIYKVPYIPQPFKNYITTQVK